MTEIIINNVWSRIRELKNIKIIDAIDRETSFYVQGYQFTRAFKQGYYDYKKGTFIHWDGKRHLVTRKLVFPTGLLARILDILERYGQEYETIDQRFEPKSQKPLKIKKYTPRPYQQEALSVAVKHGRGIIRMATGSGKTLLASMIVAHYNMPTMIYVVGKDLLYQFHKETEKALGIKVGIIGDGQCEIRKINICSVWTAATAFDLQEAVSLDDEDWTPEVLIVDSEQKKLIKKTIESSNLAIFDEAHFLATNTIQSIFKASKKCRYLFGLSGTDWRDDGADLLLESICGRRIFNLPASKLIKEKFLVPPKITLLEVPPYKDKLSNNYNSIYSKYVVENEVRNKMVEDSARVLLKKGRKVLILVKHIKHGKELAERLKDIPLFFVNGEIDGPTREEVKQQFADGELKCLIASSVFDIGVDIPSLDALILACGGKSSVRALQRIGRVIRLFHGKNDALVVDFIDNAKHLDKHSSTRIAIYQTEPSFKLKFPKNFNRDQLQKPAKLTKKIKNGKDM